MTAPDEVEEPAHRPIGAQLAVWTEKAVDAPADLVLAVWHHSTAAVFGAPEAVKDWRHWQTNRRRFLEIDDSERRGLPPGRAEGARKEARQVAQHRMRLTRWALFAALFVLVVVSVIGYWSWSPWQWLGPIATLGMLIGGPYWRAKWLTWLSPLPIPAAVLLGIDGWRWWPTWIVLGLLAVTAEIRGLHMATEAPNAPHLHVPGTQPDWKTLWNTAERVFYHHGKVITRADSSRPISSAGKEAGVAFGARCEEPIVGEDIRALERKLGFPVNGSSWVPDPKAAGGGELRLCWEDPLPPRLAPRREPMSLRYNGRFPVAMREGGRVTEIGVGRNRVILVGNSGGGKSQAMQVILDAVSDMTDATWSGIDTQGGPTLPAYRTQWNCTSVHYTEAEGLAHVRELRALCVRRNEQLREGMDEDLDGRIDQWWIVSDKPGHRGHVLFIDELSSFTATKECREELTLLLEVCRKASVSVVMGTPDLDSTRVPPAARDQAGIKAGFSMPFPDAVLLFGKGGTQAGWEPYRFDPADDDEAHDAGKSYIRGGGYNRAEVHRWFALPKDEIGDRNETRRHWRDRNVAPPAPPQDDPEIIDAEIVEPATMAAIEAVEAALRMIGERSVLPVKEATSGLPEGALAALRGAVKPASLYSAEEARSVWSYSRSALVNALNSLTGGTTA